MAQALYSVNCIHKTRPMLSKSYSISQIFARQKEEKKAKSLSRQDWIKADRVVMMLLFIAVIVGAVLFSYTQMS